MGEIGKNRELANDVPASPTVCRICARTRCQWLLLARQALRLDKKIYCQLLCTRQMQPRVTERAYACDELTPRRKSHHGCKRTLTHWSTLMRDWHAEKGKTGSGVFGGDSFLVAESYFRQRLLTPSALMSPARPRATKCGRWPSTSCSDTRFRITRGRFSSRRQNPNRPCGLGDLLCRTPRGCCFGPKIFRTMAFRFSHLSSCFVRASPTMPPARR